MNATNYFIQFVSLLSTVLTIAIVIRSLLSWFPNVKRENPLVEILFQVTEPVLGPIRRVLPTMGGIDFSPLAAILLLQFIEQAAISLVKA